MRKLALLLGLTAVACAAASQTITITPETQTYGYHSYRVKIQGLDNSNQAPVYVAPPAPIYVPNPQQYVPQPALRIPPEIALAMLQARNQALQQSFQAPAAASDVKVQGMCIKLPGVEQPSCVAEQKPKAKTCTDVAEEYRKWCKE